MILTSIEIFGFKSFGKKVRIDFDGRVTGIVGPNGSGKSNIVDAIKWALGEQRVKSLRGGKMEDVIFSGTQTRRPLGYAQVTLTLDNTSRIFQIDYDEIAITRRLFRSGESEYYINKAACRLKDIQTLLMDTGLSREGYSIIGQGQIESIVNNSPMERKLLIEEACGIVKFKSRRSDAEKKLERASANLYRITDILAELESRLPQLKRQSEKAERYLELRNELKQIEIAIFVSRMELLTSQLEKANADKAAIEASIAALGEEITELSARSEQFKAELAEYDEKLVLGNERLRENRESRQSAETERRVAQSRVESLQKQIQAAKDDIAEFEQSRDKYALEEKTLAAELAAESAHGAGLFDEYEKAREALVAVNKKYGESDEAISLRAERIAELSARLSEIQAQQNELLGRKLSAEFIAETLSSEIALRETRLSELAPDDASVSLKAALSDAVSSYNNAARAANEAGNSYEQLKERISSAFAELEGERQRLKMLTGFEESMQGYKYAVRRLSELKKNDNYYAKNLLGTVGELIETDAKYAEAISKALGGAIEYIVTTDEAAATSAIGELKRGNWGRVTFLPKNIIRAYGSVDLREIKNMRGFLGEASELVRFAPEYEQIVKNLLARTLVCDNIENANQIAKKTGYKYKLVTLEGEVLMSGGAMVGGRTKNDDEGVLARKSEIARLTELAEKHAVEYEAMLKNRAVLTETLKQQRAEAEEKKTFVEQKRAELAESEREGRALSEARSELLAQQSAAREKLAETNAQIKALAEAAEESEKLIKADSEELSELNRAAEVYASGEYKAEYSAAVNAQNEAEIARMKSAETARLLENNIKNLAEKGREANALIKGKGQLVLQLEAEIAALTESDANTSQKLQSLAQAGEALEAEWKKLSEKRGECAERAEQAAERTLAAGAERSKVSERLAGAESAVTRLTVESEHLTRDMLEDYSLSYEEALAAAESQEGEVDLTGGLTRIGELKERIKKLGSINIEAPEEYREVKNRFEDMSTQRDDLIASRDELTKIIEDISANMEKQFLREFDIIQKEFARVFSQLFSGGEARLILTDPTDIGSSGVDIMAQPPKTKLKNIASLSGGEKSMTAISLIFAILNVKPSPFTVLDEIDAALDDANVVRISEYLGGIENQFIVITHKKRTMESADVLYGASMGADGITQLLSVRMSDINEKGEIHAG